MSRGYLSLAATLVALIVASPMAAAQTCRSVVVSADPEFPPFAWYDGERLQGASVEIVLEVLKRMRLPYELRYAGPFVRLLRAAEMGEVDIITELKDTPERRVYLNYAATPIFTNPSAVFVRTDKTFPYRSQADLKGRLGGATHGTRFGNGFDEYLDAELNVERGPGIAENFRKLEAGRIDYFVSPYFPAINHLIAVRQEAQFVALKPYVATVDNFVGWSKRSPCLERLAEFDAHLAQLVRDGTVRHSLERASQAWRSAPRMAR